MTTGAAATLLLSLIGVEPRVLDPRFELQQVASAPDLVTPIGLTFDDRGRLLVIESHTHFRPDDYDGPASDRIRLVEDTDGDGEADRFETFFEGTEATMALRTGPDGWIYVATRSEVFRLRDSNADGKADERQPIAQLKTEGRYPHNGLSGLAFGPDGKLYFGQGENLGAPYALVGSDNSSLEGGGEGGNVFRCDLNGANLERFATGFWNPFGLCFDPHSRLFAVDNDPDASPPCRLLHVVPGGDYGYQFRYGRSGRHPLQAWGGELPGTLPMVAGTGEAPCAVLPFEGALWVSSWGENRIERYTIQQNGASVIGTGEVVVQGDQNFRPVDFAVSPAGDIYFTDWVDKSYPLHGQGRLWRLKTKGDAPAAKSNFPNLSKQELQARSLHSRVDADALADDDPFFRQAAVQGLVAAETRSPLEWNQLDSPNQRIGFLQASRLRGDLSPTERDSLLRTALSDEETSVQLMALRWIADSRIPNVAPAVEKLLSQEDATPDLIRVVIATLDWIGREKPLAKNDDPLARLAEILADESRPASVRAIALSLLPVNHPSLSTSRLVRLAQTKHLTLRREAVRTLALCDTEGRGKALADIASNESFPDDLRADAVLGLAIDPVSHADVLRSVASSPSSVVAAEARRVLTPSSETTTESQFAKAPIDWHEYAQKPGDANAGWRVFFRSSGAACSRCHMLNGRGSNIGPDLTTISRRTTPERLLESILEPSKEIAPQYVPWVLVTTEGKVLTGLPINLPGVPGEDEHFIDHEGKRFDVKRNEIESRHASPTSIMPAGLESAMTPQDLRDLLALLTDASRDTSEKSSQLSD